MGSLAFTLSPAAAIRLDAPAWHRLLLAAFIGTGNRPAFRIPSQGADLMLSAKDITLDLFIRYGFQVVGAVFILVVGAVLARWIGNLSDRWLQPHIKEPPTRMLIVRIVRVTVVLLTLLVALDKFGFQIAPLVAALGVAGVGIGLAFQGVLGNVVAGLSIIFTKPFRVGEYIELLGVHGQVVTIELFSTSLIQLDQSRVIIPNRKIVGEILHNYGTIRQLTLTVGVGYGANLNQVLTVAREVVAANPRVLKEPAPIIGVGELAASSVTLVIQPWVSVADVIPAKAELYQAIVERFRADDIAIPIPLQEVRLLQGS
jgi:small conductance mechanosensitive channel